MDAFNAEWYFLGVYIHSSWLGHVSEASHKAVTQQGWHCSLRLLLLLLLL
jgi:hypothetical protein